MLFIIKEELIVKAPKIIEINLQVKEYLLWRTIHISRKLLAAYNKSYDKKNTLQTKIVYKNQIWAISLWKLNKFIYAKINIYCQEQCLQLYIKV